MDFQDLFFCDKLVLAVGDLACESGGRLLLNHENYHTTVELGLGAGSIISGYEH